MVHPGGRPRLVAPPPEECIILGKELVEWATEPTSEIRVRMAQWYSEIKHILRKDWKNLIQMPEFLPYYEEARSALAQRCLDGTIKEGFGHRYLRLYDRDLIEEENEHAKFEAEIKAKEQKLASEEDHKRFDMFMSYLKEVKEDHNKELHSSDLNNADKRYKRET